MHLAALTLQERALRLPRVSQFRRRALELELERLGLVRRDKRLEGSEGITAGPAP